MQCPNCYSLIDGTTRICSRCGYDLYNVQSGLGMVTAGNVDAYLTSHTIIKLQLTKEQRKTLFRDARLMAYLTCIPIGFMIQFIIQTDGLSRIWNGSSSVWIAVVFWLVLPFMIVMLQIRSITRSVQDGYEGTVWQAIDMLEKKKCIRGSNKIRYYGYFRKLGKVSLEGWQYGRGFEQRAYAITYSPRSKRVWNVEDLKIYHQA